MIIKPTNYFITSGVGTSTFELVAFDKALLQSGISNYNLVKVSSILPPGCNEQKSVSIEEGSILHTAYSYVCSDKVGIISAAIAVAIPCSDNDVGVIMEYSCFKPKEYAEKRVVEMLKESMSERNIQIKDIKLAASETHVQTGTFSCVLAALAMW